MSNLNWIFDALGGILLILMIIHGIRKGAGRTLVPFLINLVFVVLAFFMKQPLMRVNRSYSADINFFHGFSIFFMMSR